MVFVLQLCRHRLDRSRHRRGRGHAGLESHESVKRFELLSEGFTAENGLLTPTMKKIRPEIKTRYSDRIEEIYDEAAFADEDRFRNQATADD